MTATQFPAVASYRQRHRLLLMMKLQQRLTLLLLNNLPLESQM
jgi:hypothetical protein